MEKNLREIEQNLREIEQIMQKFYAKKAENEELFNINKKEEDMLKAQIAELKDKRTNERKSLKEKFNNIESGQIEHKKISIPTMQNFRDSYKPILYQIREEILTDKISEFELKEEQLNKLKEDLNNLDSRINQLMQFYVSGIDEYDAILVEVFKGKDYDAFKNEIIAEIEKLTEELKEKQSIEMELNDLRLKRKNDMNSQQLNVPFARYTSSPLKFNLNDEEQLENSDNELDVIDQNTYIKESLERLKKAVEANFPLKIRELQKKSAEERDLDKQIKALNNRPKYDRVYLREMFELKYTLEPLFTEQRKIVESYVNAELDKINQSILSIQQEIADRNKALQDKENQVNVFKKTLADMPNIATINTSETKDILEKFKDAVDDLAELKSQNDNDKIELINSLSEQKSELEAILIDLENKSNLLRHTKDELNAYSKMEPFEQEEYDRRKAMEKAAEEKRKILEKEAEEKRREELRLEYQRITDKLELERNRYASAKGEYEVEGAAEPEEETTQPEILDLADQEESQFEVPEIIQPEEIVVQEKVQPEMSEVIISEKEQSQVQESNDDLIVIKEDELFKKLLSEFSGDSSNQFEGIAEKLNVISTDSGFISREFEESAASDDDVEMCEYSTEAQPEKENFFKKIGKRAKQRIDIMRAEMCQEDPMDSELLDLSNLSNFESEFSGIPKVKGR